jgi:TolB-like protein/tetratricopeptide (TPR) repeat protein
MDEPDNYENNRRLAGILAADAVGYSRMLAQDESSTLARMRALHANVIEPQVAAHGGRVFKSTGDGFLAAFASAVQALRCAIAIQGELRAQAVGLALRIGVHQGEVVPEGDDLLGDGVVVAARLEPLADSGGICISGRVREDAAGKVAMEVEDLGVPELKNIDQPIRVFRVRPGRSRQAAPQLPDEPSLAVLPFQNMSGDPEQEYFADGMVEELITALSRVRWLFVIARNSSFSYKGKSPDIRQVSRELGVRYVLEGSVRKVANRVRITGQLIDAATGSHIWADRFDGELADIFDLQDQVTMGVVGAIEPRLLDAEVERAQRKPTANLQAYDLILRALPGLYTLNQARIEQAIALVNQAIELDPDYARALAVKARLQVRRVFTIGADASAASIAETVRIARIAVEKGRDDPEVLWMASFTVALAGGKLHDGMSLIARSLSLNPHCAEALAHAAMICAYTGDRPATIAYADRALRLNPMGRAVYNIYYARGVLDFIGRDYAGCLDWTTKSLQEMPEFAPALRYRAASFSCLGRHDEAQEAVRQLRIVTPHATIASIRPHYRLPQMAGALDPMLEGLRQAGLPEA